MRQLSVLLAMGIAGIGIAAPAFIDLPKLLIWNVSASAPIGLYRVVPANTFHVGDLVAVMPPELIASFLDQRDYLPVGVPLLKRVLALPGQTICRARFTIAVDGIEVGKAHAHDRRGRALPDWQGCEVIAAGNLFLMNRDVPGSLDGRYFGPMPARSVIGIATLLWINGEVDHVE